jgi:hypothetical protein
MSRRARDHHEVMTHRKTSTGRHLDLSQWQGLLWPAQRAAMVAILEPPSRYQTAVFQIVPANCNAIVEFFDEH